MAVQMLKIGKQEYVLLRKRDYEQLAAKAARRPSPAPQDVAESRRRMREPGGRARRYRSEPT